MINRRSFISALTLASAGFPRFGHDLARATLAPRPEPMLARPTPDQLAWQDLEFGMFVHPDPTPSVRLDNPSTDQPAIDLGIDTDQWADCAVGLGAKYIVFVAKNTAGFCMWQTDTTAYSIKNTRWRNGHGDIIADLAISCQKRGLKLGVYLCPRDDNFGARDKGQCDPDRQPAYNALYRRQLTEVLSRYGNMVEIWFDGSLIVPVEDILKQYAQHSMIFQGPYATIRWVGNEDGLAPYPAWNSISEPDARTGIATAMHGDTNGSVWLPVEADVSILYPAWLWSEDDEPNLLSLDALLEIYYRSVGRGAQLLLNVPPNQQGLISQADYARAQEFGKEIRRRFDQSVVETRATGNTITLQLPAAQRIDHVILQEDCSSGERVRAYRIEGQTGTKWIGLGDGTSIGHKRIQPVPPTTVSALRFVATASIGTPVLRRFAVFNTGSEAPAKWNAPAQVWADDEVEKWKGPEFEIDLSSKITVAGQYRFRLVPRGPGTIVIGEAGLLFDGVSRRGFVRRLQESPDALVVTIPAMGPKVVVKGRVSGAEQGSALLQKM